MIIKLWVCFVCMVAFVRVTPVHPRKECRFEDIFECENSSGIQAQRVIGQYFQNKALPDVDSLTKICGKLVNFYDCVIKAREACGGYTTGSIVARDGVSLLCNETTVERKVYAKNVDCMNKQISNMMKCASESQNFASSQFGDYKNLTEEEKKEKFCLGFIAEKNICILGIPARMCDPQIYNLADNMIRGGYSYQREKCPDNMAEDVQKKYKNQLEAWMKNYLQ